MDEKDQEIPGGGVERQVGESVSKMGLEDLVDSMGRVAQGAVRQLGLVGGDPSPYVICERNATRRAVVRTVGGVVLLAIAFSLLPVSGVFALLGTSASVVVLAIAIVFAALGLWGILQGSRRRRLAKALAQVAKAVGERQSVPLVELAGRVEVPVGQLGPLVGEAIKRGLIPEGRLDAPLGTQTLYLTTSSWEDDCTARDAVTAARAQAESRRQELTEDACEVVEACSSFVTRIHALGPRVSDGKVFLSLEGIASKVAGLSDYVAAHPEAASQLRRAVTYYLPTTAKLASSYVELEGCSESPEASSTKEELKRTIALVDSSLARLSDELLREQSWDLRGDMKVMRTMLEQDGLADGRDDVPRA